MPSELAASLESQSPFLNGHPSTNGHAETNGHSSGRKTFVLDSSVILYDSQSLKNFAEHDVAVPLAVLEEVDGFKKGNAVINLQAREFARQLDSISTGNIFEEWLPLNGATHGKVRVLATNGHPLEIPGDLASNKNDNHILAAALRLQKEHPDRKIVLVSKDVNLRLKARALKIHAEDYETSKVRDVEQLQKGHETVPIADDAALNALFAEGPQMPEAFGLEDPVANHYFVLKSPSKSALAVFNPENGRIEHLRKQSAYGISPKNAEQSFALHAILNPAVQLVTISGPAGTGKTLLALAGALEQRKLYRQIYLGRPIVPLSNKDLGYLPGDIASKINPYMQPLWDNLGFIKGQFDTSASEFKRVDEMVEQEKLHIVPLAYIRGRSFARVMFIVDEAQNLTPHEVKTIVTRAGEGTKIVLTGDIFQIDTPYLDTQSNGLSYLIGRMRGQPLHAHVNLVKGERSKLAELASQLL